MRDDIPIKNISCILIKSPWKSPIPNFVYVYIYIHIIVIIVIIIIITIIIAIIIITIIIYIYIYMYIPLIPIESPLKLDPPGFPQFPEALCELPVAPTNSSKLISPRSACPAFFGGTYVR